MEAYKEGKEQLRKYLKNLDNACKKKFGKANRYVPPTNSSPYLKYRDAADFQTRVLKKEPEVVHIDRNCKRVNMETLGVRSVDDRYFTDVANKNECMRVAGVWDSSSINRNDRYTKGVCWTTRANKACGLAAPPDILRPYPRKAKDVSDAAAICAAVPTTRFKSCALKRKTKYTYDCEVALRDPPPFSLTAMETFIKDYYSNKVRGWVPPTTLALEGIGNRCVPSSHPDEEPKPVEQDNEKQYEDFKKLDPTKPGDLRRLKQYMSLENIAEYKKHWRIVKAYGYARYKQLYKGEKDIYSAFHHARDVEQFEQDEPLSPTLNVNKGIPAPSIPQSVVNTVMRRIAISGDKKRGLIAWHSVGSGKTCTATGVMDAFWDISDRTIIYASSIDALASNPPSKFHECARNLFPRFAEMSDTTVAQEFKRRDVRFLSFARLANRVMAADTRNGKKNQQVIDLNSAVLIIDEVHNLFRPLANQKKQHQYLEKALTNPERFPALKIVILTATPGDSVADVIKLLNIVRTPSDPVIAAPDTSNAESIRAFKRHIRGLVSFFDMTADTTKFPVVVDSGLVKVPMSIKQFAKYLEAYKGVKEAQKDFEGLALQNTVAKYWEPARKYANTMFNFDKDMQLSEFSSKLPKLLEQIGLFPRQKHYIYSSFYTRMGYGGHGVIAIAKELDKAGYEKLTLADARRGALSAKKRYILAVASDLGSSAGALDTLLSVFNKPENKHGELVQIVLASQNFNEGIDLKAVRHIHFFEPLVTMASDKQTIGRAARYCSHADLDRDAGEWSVQIHRYASAEPVIPVNTTLANLTVQLKALAAALRKAKKDDDNDAVTNIQAQQKDLKVLQSILTTGKNANINIEEQIFRESRERIKDIFTIYQCMKEAALDCRVLHRFHSATGSPISCEEYP